MTPIAESVLSGLAIRAATGLAKQTARLTNLSPERRRVPTIGDRIDLEEVKDTIIRSLQESVSSTFTDLPPAAEALLLSQDVGNLLTQILVVRLVGGSTFSVDAPRAEFAEILRLFASGESSVTALEAQLFGALLQACDSALMALSQAGRIEQAVIEDAKDRYALIQLSAINRNLDLLRRLEPDTLARNRSFERKYRSQVHYRHRDIIPPNFGTVRRVNIDDIYVEPRLERYHSVGSSANHAIGYDELRETVHRTVILGDPGGGKSTLSLKLTHQLAQTSSQSATSRTVTPILVVVREYGSQRAATGCSIVDYIASTCAARYQVDPPPEVIEYLLLNGSTLVIFDGLDELLDTSYRQEITRDVEAFCNLYPSADILVTSRVVGYDQAPLDADLFEAYRLAGLDDSQVATYAKKWFALEFNSSARECQELASSFLRESTAVSDLRKNPLMLALMCNIYRGENYIPANRPDVYEKCAVMLFERWDKSRNIRVGLPIESQIRPAMMYLAYQIYSNSALQTGVRQSALERMTAEYLLSRGRYEEPDEARNAAQEFIEFCTGRAWVFTDVGTTDIGERLYQFTHRTFLEYFTASHLTRVQSQPELLLEFLEPRIAAAEWDMVAQLALQMQHERVEDAADIFLAGLMQRVSGGAQERYNRLSFGARALRFLVVNASIVRSIGEAVTLFGVSDLSGEITARSEFAALDPRLAMLGHVMNVGEENLAASRSALFGVLSTRVRSGDPMAATLLAHFPVALNRVEASIPLGRPEYWRVAARQLVEEDTDAYIRLALDEAASPALPVWYGIVSVDEFINRLGEAAVFRSFTSPYLEEVPSLAEFIVLDLLHSDEPKLGIQARFARSLLSRPTPWFKRNELPPDGDRFGLYLGLEGRGAEALIGVDADVVAGGITLVCVLTELRGERAFGDVRGWPGSARDEEAEVLGLNDLLRGLVMARVGDAQVTGIGDALRHRGLRPEEVNTITSWATGRLSFIAPSSKIATRGAARYQRLRGSTPEERGRSDGRA